MHSETIVTNDGAARSGHAPGKERTIRADKTHWAGSAIGFLVLTAEVLLCCAQWYMRSSPVGDLYCLSNFLECTAPRVLILGSEIGAIALAVLVALLAVGINLTTVRRLLALNAVALALLAAASAALIGEHEIGQLCNLDKTFTIGGIAWADLTNKMWMRTWVGVLPLGGVPIQVTLAMLSLLGASLSCRRSAART